MATTAAGLSAAGVAVAVPASAAVPAVAVPMSPSSDPIAAHYAALGGPKSFLGAATGPEYALPGGEEQDYQNGSIFYSASTGAWSVHGAILAHYRQLGGPTGFLGYPITDETGTPDGVGRYNHFANYASIYWTPSTGAWSVHGAIRAHWAALGWERSVVGYPVSDETGTPDGVGRYNGFASGMIYWTPGTGAWSVHGAILGLWGSMGYERSPLGYPISDEYAVPGGRRSNFQNGSITWQAATGATSVSYSNLGQAAVAEAALQAGKPYVYGAAGPDAFDCSGLVQYVFGQLGYSLPRTAADQEAALPPIPQDQLQPGDVVFLYDSTGYVYHDGIYAGNQTWWVASQPGTVVQQQQAYWMIYPGYTWSVGRVG